MTAVIFCQGNNLILQIILQSPSVKEIISDPPAIPSPSTAQSLMLAFEMIRKDVQSMY